MMSRTFALIALRAFFFGVMRRKYPFPLLFRTRRRSNPRNPKASPCQCVHHLGFLLVQFHTKRCELFLEPLQGAFSPASFGMVSADGDDDIIGEPMIVHCLVGSLRRLTAYRVEATSPVRLSRYSPPAG